MMNIISDINGNTCAEKPLEGYNDLLTVNDLSEIFNIGKQTVYREIKLGKFGKPIKFGRSYRIPKIYIVQRYLGGFNSESETPV